MRGEQHVLCAVALDEALGDPRWLPHPVRLMGGLAVALEEPCRRRLNSPKAAGVAVATIAVGATVLATWGCEHLARRVHPLVGDLTSILLLASTLAARDLSDHALLVLSRLEVGDIGGARQAVGRMVGRDVQSLDETQIVRAAIESVAENMVDGVTAPLFYACLGGAPAAMGFKAVSTLDSTFGYKNERYAQFGWASARLDDLANYVPARLTVPFAALAARLLGMSATDLLRTAWQDGRKHASPNSGLAESAMAGALGVRLGGPLTRAGAPSFAPWMGQSRRPLRRAHIRNALALMQATSLLSAGFLAVSRRLVGW